MLDGLQSYSNAAARTNASLIKFPPVTLTHQSKLAHDAAQQTGASNASEPGPEITKKRKKSEAGDGASDSSTVSQKKQSKVEEALKAAAADTALVDDNIDWTATSDQPHLQSPSSADDVQQVGMHQLGASEHDTGIAHPQSAEPPSKSESIQQQPAEVAAQEVPSRNDDTGDKYVQHAVAEYVKALLDPFFKAGIVDREVNSHKLCLHV